MEILNILYPFLINSNFVIGFIILLSSIFYSVIKFERCYAEFLIFEIGIGITIIVGVGIGIFGVKK